MTDLEARLIRIERVVENQSLVQLASELDRAAQRDDRVARRDRDVALRNGEQRQPPARAVRRRRSAAAVARDGAARRSRRRRRRRAPPFGCAGRSGRRRSGRRRRGAPSRQRPAELSDAAFDLIAGAQVRGGGHGVRDVPDAVPDEPARRQRAVLARRDALRARSVSTTRCRSSARSSSSIRSPAKLPDALLKVGYCQIELGDRSAARTSLQGSDAPVPGHDGRAARVAATRPLVAIGQARLPWPRRRNTSLPARG